MLPGSKAPVSEVIIGIRKAWCGIKGGRTAAAFQLSGKKRLQEKINFSSGGRGTRCTV
jgi:hypothetical protein